MNTLKQIEQLKKLHGMIKNQTTGSPKMVAKKMHVSERQLYNLLDQLRTMDAPLHFDRRANTYIYTDDFEFSVSISVEVIHNDHAVKIYGGKSRLKVIASLQGLCSPQGYLGQVMTQLVKSDLFRS